MTVRDVLELALKHLGVEGLCSQECGCRVSEGFCESPLQCSLVKISKCTGYNEDDQNCRLCCNGEEDTDCFMPTILSLKESDV